MCVDCLPDVISGWKEEAVYTSQEHASACDSMFVVPSASPTPCLE